MKKKLLYIKNFLKSDNGGERIIFVSIFFILFLIFYTHSIVVDSRLDLNIDPINTFKTYFYTWNQGLAFGQDYTVMSSYIFPLGFFYFFFSLFSNIYITQALIFSLSLFIGFYSFVKFVENEFGSKSVYSYIGGLLYIFNLYTLINISSAYLNLTLPYLILPLQLYLLKRVCLEQNYLKYIFYFSIATLFMGGINPPLVAINLIVIFVYFIHLLLKHRLLEKKSLALRIFLCFSVTLLINFYWVSGTLFSWLSMSAEGMKIVLSEPLPMHNAVSSYLNVFRTLGLWAFEQSNGGIPYFSYAAVYMENPFLIFSMYLLPIMCFGSILLTKKNKQAIWILVLAVFSISMAVASNQGIFASAYVWAYNHVPLFSMFRSSYKFVQVYIFTLSFLLVSSLFAIQNSRIKKIVAGIFLFLIVLNGFPFFTGKVFNESMKIKIPEYYYNAQSFFKGDKLLSRILLLPNQYGAVYKWGNTKGNPELLWDKGLVVRLPITEIETSNKITLKIYGDILDGKYEEANNILGTLNVAYITQRNDFDWEYYKSISQSPEVIKEALSPYHKIKTFGELDVYATEKDNFLPYFYIPQTIITTPQSLEILPEIVSQDDYNIRSAIYFNNKNNELKKETINNTPVTEFKKINPTKYRVVIHNAKENFPLVFSESFNGSWRSYLVNHKKDSINFNEADYRILDGNGNDQASTEELKNFVDKGYVSSIGDLGEKNIEHSKWEKNKEIFDYYEKYKIDFISKNFQDTIQNDNLKNGNFYETWFKKPIDNNKNHLTANGYANSWTIDPQKVCEAEGSKCVKNPDGTYDLELVVEFWPQRLFYLGVIISGATLLACIVYLLYNFVKEKKVINKKIIQ